MERFQSQEELAAELGIGIRTLRDWELGTHEPRLSHLYKLRSILSDAHWKQVSKHYDV